MTKAKSTKKPPTKSTKAIAGKPGMSVLSVHNQTMRLNIIQLDNADPVSAPGENHTLQLH